MKRFLPVILCLLLAALAVGLLTGELTTDKRVSNPIPEGATALVFGSQEETGPCRVVTDQAVINRLRSAYRWTNHHLICCLDGEVAAYVDALTGSRLAPWDVSKDKVYADRSVASYNIEFRCLLYRAWENAVPMYRTVVYAPDASACAAIRETLLAQGVPADCLAAYDPHVRNNRAEIHIITPEALTDAQQAALKRECRVTFP